MRTAHRPLGKQANLPEWLTFSANPAFSLLAEGLLTRRPEGVVRERDQALHPPGMRACVKKQGWDVHKPKMCMHEHTHYCYLLMRLHTKGRKKLGQGQYVCSHTKQVKHTHTHKG